MYHYRGSPYNNTSIYPCIVTPLVCRPQFQDFTKNGRKFSKVETLGKGEIAHYEQFLLLPQCFQKTSTAGVFYHNFKILLKMEESFQKWRLREKEKLLVTSNFSFYHSVFKRLPTPGLFY